MISKLGQIYTVLFFFFFLLRTRYLLLPTSYFLVPTDLLIQLTFYFFLFYIWQQQKFC